jgi:hypothetical protein
MQPDVQRLAGGAERTRSRRACVVVRIGECREGEMRFGRSASRRDGSNAFAIQADDMIADGGLVGRRQDVRAVDFAHCS